MAAVSGQLKPLWLVRLHDSYEKMICTLICSKNKESYMSYMLCSGKFVLQAFAAGRKRMIQRTSIVCYPHREVSLANLKA